MHLDLKPANVFIDFEGVLKIGDFGLACEWPAPPNVEGEGDRRYIGPDLLQGNFDKPADIFALGMIMYEIAGNCIPPDNGHSWQKLRSGDFSGLPSLTSASSRSLAQEESAEKLGYSRNCTESESVRVQSHESLYSPPAARTFFDDPSDDECFGEATDKRFGAEVESVEPPRFMQDPKDPESLDNVVQWMMLPEPSSRPVVDQVLQTTGCNWVNERRRGGAVVYEGKWGPVNTVTPNKSMEDEEMPDA